jgi:cobalt-zinc-cadmium efflux system protein
MPETTSHSHDINSITNSPKKEKKAFYLSLIIAIVFMLLEIIFGVIANSLALISDALHMLIDAGALLLALVVVSLTKRPRTRNKSYGYLRAEVLGALANGIILFILTIFLVYEAIERLIIHSSHVKGPIVFIIATIGLIANIVMIKLLHPGNNGSLNIKAAYLHVLGDLLGSIGVIISGIIITLTKWYPIDAICTILFALIILYSSGKMIKHAINVLMESVPPNINIDKVKLDLLSIDGVDKIHDLHIWNISSQMISLSVHLECKNAKFSQKNILSLANDLLQKKYNIYHTTIQIEDEKNSCDKSFDCQQ